MNPAIALGAEGHAAVDECSDSGQFISQLCFALKAKLEKALDHPKNMLLIASIKSLEEELSISVALFRRVINRHDSTIHRLPPEVLVVVASHLDDNESLIAATHVCHRWRSTFLSFPHLWSHVVVSNTQHTLAFLERSGSTLVSVCLPRDNEPPEAVKELLKSNAGRLIWLKGSYNTFMSEFLTQPLPLLRDLDLFGSSRSPSRMLSAPALPSVRSLAARDLEYPPERPFDNLTNLHFEVSSSSKTPPEFGGGLLRFLLSCPLLEVVHFSGLEHRGLRSTLRYWSRVVPLPRLRSFTHDSPFDKLDIALFERLSVPPTCDLAFSIVVGSQTPRNIKWTDAFPAPRDPSYASDIKTVKITADAPLKTHSPKLRVELFNSKNARISFTFNQIPHAHRYFAATNALGFLDSSGIARPVETLCLEDLDLDERPMTRHLMGFDSLKTLIIRPSSSVGGDMFSLEIARNVAVRRQKNGIPLETVTLYFDFTERSLRYYGEIIEELKSSVESMELVKVDD